MNFQSPDRIKVQSQIPNDFWQRFQGNPVDLEIGCGVGYHPLQYSLSHPERALIAIERTKEKFQKFKTRYVNHHKPTNLFPVHAEATHWVYRYIPDSHLDHIFIFYPNPYPKPKQKNQRWAYSSFIPVMLQKLKLSGRIQLVTNLFFYSEEVKTEFIHTWGLKLVQNLIVDPDRPPRSHFEKKYLSRGDKCFDMIFEKTE